MTHRAGMPPPAPTEGGCPEHTHTCPDLMPADGGIGLGTRCSQRCRASQAQHREGAPGRDPGRPHLAGGPGNVAPVGLDTHPKVPKGPEASLLTNWGEGQTLQV